MTAVVLMATPYNDDDAGGDWFVLKIPRCDTNGVGEYGVIVTSELHAQ